MAKQLLHLVFGGELEDPGGVEFADLDALDIVGIYPDYKTRPRGLAGRGAEDRRRCARALLHRPPAPAARPGDRHDPGVTMSSNGLVKWSGVLSEPLELFVHGRIIALADQDDPHASGPQPGR